MAHALVRLTLVSSLCWAAGCDFDADYRAFCERTHRCESSDAGVPSTASSDAGQQPSRSVTGTWLRRWAVEGPQGELPFAGAPPNLIVQNETSESLVPARWTAQGQFLIPDVPPGPYLLHLDGPVWVASTQRVLDVSWVALGRADAGSAGLNTELTARVTGPTSEQSDFASLVISSTSGGARAAVELGLLNDAGTSTEATGQWTALLPGPQDTLFVTQLLIKNPDQLSCSVSVGQAVTTASLASNSRNELAVTLKATPQLRLTTSWDRPAFVALGDPRHRSLLQREYLYFYASPQDGLALPLEGFEPSFGVLVSCEPTVPPISGPAAVDLTAVSPFPATWPLTRLAGIDFRMPVTTEDGGTSFFTASVIEAVDNQSAPATTSPTLGPVTRLLVAGRDATILQLGVGLTPTISWERPLRGTPGLYRLRIFQLGTTGSTTVFDLTTTVTGVKVPQGVLSAGASYAMRVTAESRGGVDAATTPFLTSRPYSQADLVSERFTP